MFQSVNSPCGIGGPSNPSGPCTGTYSPAVASQAGKGAFSSISTSSVISTLIAAGLLIAGVLFAAWIVRVVGSFFSKSSSDQDITHHPDFGAAEKARAHYEYREFRTPDAESDSEDDVEDDSPVDQESEETPL